MQRFFIPAGSFHSSEVRLTGETMKQVRQVLRMRPGERLTLLDGLGNEYLAQLTGYGKDEALCEVLEKRPGSGEPRVQVDLYLSVLNKPDKFEWALQKCTELGAARFIPVVAERSVSGLPAASKLQRWERIIQEAAEQSGRSLLPTLEGGCTLAQAFELEREASVPGRIAIIPSLHQSTPLADALGTSVRPTSTAVFIGPEGGFTEREMEAAQAAGIRPLTLGARTLRAETAAVAVLAVMMYEFGEMDGPGVAGEER